MLIAVHISLASSLHISGFNDGIEQIWVKIRISSEINWYLGVSYIPPDADFEKYKRFTDFSCNAVRECSDMDRCFLFGDFNLPRIEWIVNDDDTTHFLPLNVSSDIEKYTIDSFFASNLLQVNGFANYNDHFLDLIFTNASNESTVTPASMPLLQSSEAHHFPLEICVETITDNLREQSADDDQNISFDFRNLNYQDFEWRFSINDWHSIFKGLTASEMSEALHNVINNILQDIAPIKRHRAQSTKPRWMSRTLINLINRQKVAHQRYMMANRDANLHKIYSNIRRKAKQQAKLDKKTYLFRMERNIRANPKDFFRYVNEKRKTDSMPSTMTFDNKKASNIKETTNLFADFFSKVYVKVENADSETTETNDNTFDIPHLTLNQQNVENAMAKLNDTLDFGPDGLPSLFIKRCASFLSVPVTIIFNHSLRTSEFPTTWKISTIRPIYKNGSRSDITNYRSIAKLAFIPKIFEALVCDHIAFFARSLIPTEQHGFVKNRSTVTNLAEFAQFTLNAMEKIGQVDAIYKDLSKAFDKVSHRRLCHKLISLGFPRYWVDWIRSYLTNRTQRVKIGNTTSFDYNVFSGVPAGSHPIAFCTFRERHWQSHQIQQIFNVRR